MLLTLGLLMPAVARAQTFGGGSGTFEDPYLISSTEHMTALANSVSDGNTYFQKEFRLVADLDFTGKTYRPIGTRLNPFKGTFRSNNHTISNVTIDGDGYVALFGNIKDAFIYNLTLGAGSSIRGQIYVAGIVACSRNSRIENCHVAEGVSITVRAVSSTIAGQAGGIIGTAEITTYVENCTNAATITDENTSNLGYIGGIVGYADTQGLTLSISGCVNLGAVNGYNWVGGILGQCTESVTNDNVNITGCYMGGNCAIGALGVGGSGTGTNEGVDVPWLCTLSFADNVVCNGKTPDPVAVIGSKDYYPGGSNVGLQLAYNGDLPPFHVATFEASEGTLSPNGSQYDLTFPSTVSDVVVAATVSIANIDPADFSGSGSETDPYVIHTAAGWDVFCDALQDNDTYNRFQGKTVKLGASISVTQMAGSAGHDFMGTFDGDGNWLMVNYGNSNNYISEAAVAPFRFVEGPSTVIRNLTVDGFIRSEGQFASGLIGYQYGTTTISNCNVNVHIYTREKYAGGFIGRCGGAATITNCRREGSIYSHVSGDGSHGGFVALAASGSGLSITGCLFNGSLRTLANTDNCGGFIGWNSTQATIADSYFRPWDSNIGSSGSATFSRNGTNIINCYYSEEFNDGTNYTGQGKLAQRNSAILPLGEPIAIYDVSYLTIYANGITYSGGYSDYFYYDPERNYMHTVAGYGTGEGNWRFIASPIEGNVEAETVGNIFGATEYDLYRFNQSANLEWENYKKDGGHYHFELENGRGYLYASKEDATLVFRGTYNAATEPVEVPLAYDANAHFAGWNLVGNPFPVAAYADRSYYTMNADGTAIEPNMVSAATPIDACTGVMMQTTAEEYEAGTNKVTFSRTAQQSTPNQGNIQIAVAQANMRGNSVEDKAIISFNEGDRLEKFVFNEKNAKIYIPQGGKDYAIAIANVSTDVARNVSTNEIPVNFKAAKNGTYTVSVNAKNMELDYLHLIDNLTGADVDLLHPNAVIAGEDPQSPTPSYTFTAKTTDYASRFRLVFAADGSAAPDQSFAYYADGEIVIVGDTFNASLQVVDMTGRVIVCTDGACTVSTNGMAKGVYVLRLVNGTEVRTQKIVID